MTSEERSNLARLLSPETLAVVGANEELGMSNNAVLPMLEAGIEVSLVNPRRDVLYGRPVFPDLAAIGKPVDAVLSLVNATRAVDLVEEAAALGCGGVAVVAAGFIEAGEDGAALQARLVDVAVRSGIAVIGPNCAGFKNVPLGVNFFTGGRLELPASGEATIGGVSIVSQSGFLVRSALAAAGERALGVSIAVSSGNEAVCDLADHVSVLTGDPLTSVICLVIETVRRPDVFFAAVSEARSAGKPVIALKLGRSDRARRIMQSHTGAIADESWVYDLAFREHGVIPARDIDDLLDRAQLFVQLPPERRGRIGRIGMITSSGGVAALATDLADEVGAPLPPLPEIEEWVRERVPGDTVNPLDFTGFVPKPEIREEIFEHYAGVVDALALGWWTGAQDESWSGTLLAPFAKAAARCDIPFIVCPIEATSVGGWVAEWRARGLAFTRGVESLYRAVDALDRFAAPVRGELAVVMPDNAAAPEGLVPSEVGPMVRFADAMRLLADAGIAVAPWLVVEEGADIDLRAIAALGASLVVKLADVAHRTELDAVRVGVAPKDVPGVVAQMRAIASANGASATVAVQAMVSGHAEAFGGLQCRTGLGPVVLLGLGGVLVEVTRQVAGRFLPLDEASVSDLAEEVVVPAGRLRGQKPWPVDAVADVLRGLDRLWRQHGAWLDSIDVNPMIVSDQGVVAVDVLMIART